MKNKILNLLNEKFNVFIERQDQRYCVFFEEIENPNLSTIWFDKAKKSFIKKPIGLSEYTIVDSDTVNILKVLNETLQFSESDLPKIRKIIMEHGHEIIKKHFQ
jgi:hypothetical protein